MNECLGVVWHACNPSTCRVEAGGSLPSPFEAGLNFMRLSQNRKMWLFKNILKNKGFILG